MKIKDLTPNADNPRTITDAKFNQLKKAIKEFGDLSGIVFNRKTGKLIGGHQRIKALGQGHDIVITKEFSKPTKTGTVAFGFVEIGTDQFPYREVYWTNVKEKAATIAANKNAGEWDMPKLNSWLKELSDFDLDFDVGLTMFDDEELAEFPDKIEVSAHTRKVSDGEAEEKERGPAKCKAGEVYALGDTRIKCGADDLHYCDLIIARWEKYSDQVAVLQTKTQTKRAAKPLANRSVNGN